jgi:aspartyl-tRNA(Asn)/glutamyl-tRNA(Gln) amidotransferase subunit A
MGLSLSQPVRRRLVSELHHLGAAEAARLIAAHELSPAELVDALLKRVAALEPQLQVWATLDADGARAQAAELAEEAAAGRLRGPLHGVPIGVKDIFAVAGLPTRAGSRVYNHTPTDDATTVARLRAAGAIIMGKTHTTEFAMADPAPTRNPWNLEHTPGGSSSGSAAGVAAGMMPAALGTQTAGSVLRPAAFCGVVGLKPTWGRVSRHGILPLAWSLDHAGTLTRTVEDAALLLSVMAGPDRRDPSCSAVRLDDYLAATGSPATPRIGIVGDVYAELLTAPARQALHGATLRFAESGARIVELVLPPEFEAAADVHHVLMASEVAGVHLSGVTERGGDYGPRLRGLVQSGALVPAVAYIRAQQVRRAIRSAVVKLFDQVDVLLVPSAAGAAPPGLETTGDPAFNGPWSLLGLPTISLPAGLDEHGMPLGVQLVAAPWQEARLLAAGGWCEQRPGSAPLPPTPSLAAAREGELRERS